MKKIRLGILGTSEIAFRRFLPALKKHNEFEYIGVASRNIERQNHLLKLMVEKVILVMMNFYKIKILMQYIYHYLQLSILSGEKKLYKQVSIF